MLTPLIVLTAEETVACRRLVELALEEDLNSTGDVTSQAIIPEELTGRAVLAARTAGVLAGLPAAAQVFHTVDPKIDFRPVLDDVFGEVRGILLPGDHAIDLAPTTRCSQCMTRDELVRRLLLMQAKECAS